MFTKSPRTPSNPNKITNNAINQLKKYFNHELTKFDLPLALEGTIFQRKVWSELKNIPYGKITTYKEIAERIGNSKAMRAVGNANGKNPIAIVIPCHRVIQTSGKLGGYSAGIDKKKWLLEHERKLKK
ncbi:MAG: methylated-DNA--[protein]-cysteine S-methyltransferase [Candidatus Lokiarchaeota archaeon]|nr:methylated-DNA--[protein]-cysteine S-methyltransferase [Candidatus Harpocratesius repetitus]